MASRVGPALRRIRRGARLSDVWTDRIGERVYIVASPFKTATTTVGHALVDLGAGRRVMGYDGALMRQAKPLMRRLNAWVADDMSFANFSRLHGWDVRRAMLSLLPALEAFGIYADAPFGHTHFHPFIRKVVAPQARFIWVNRDTRDWLRSARRWETGHLDVYRTTVSGQTIPRRGGRICGNVGVPMPRSSRGFARRFRMIVSC